ncbi:mitochondrial carrier homolog 2-like [Artemia franciscana]|uniref:mitochondrial carrier homolog 2-like n=1 Tax=Artemia franciscana TaxID=6661 RepID=UPI0032DB1449
MCAQFVGSESIYKDLTSSFREILSTEGIKGLLAGVTPRLIGEVLFLVISSSVAFAVSRFFQPSWITGFFFFSVLVLVSPHLILPLRCCVNTYGC